MKLITILLSTIIVAMFAMPFNVSAKVELGILKCRVVENSRTNSLSRSTADVECTFNNQGTIERYKGVAGIVLGADASFKSNEQFAFGVISSKNIKSDATGKYVTTHVGKPLEGAGENSFNLQPLKVETSQGIGASCCIGFLYIEKHN